MQMKVPSHGKYLILSLHLNEGGPLKWAVTLCHQRCVLMGSFSFGRCLPIGDTCISPWRVCPYGKFPVMRANYPYRGKCLIRGTVYTFFCLS